MMLMKHAATVSNPMEERRYSDLQIVGRLLQQAKPLWPALVGTLLVNLLSSPLALLGPLPTKLVVDHVIGTRPPPAFLQKVMPQISYGKLSMLLFAIGQIGRATCRERV